MLISGQKPTRTMLTKENQPNKSVAADGCIVPKVALNGKAPIVLTDVGKELFDLWESERDEELNAVLDEALMLQLKEKLVESLEDRKKAEKQLAKDEVAAYGFKKLSKSKPCHNCETNTLKSYNFGDKSRKAIPFCHRKDCVEARNDYAENLPEQDAEGGATEGRAAQPVVAPKKKSAAQPNLFVRPAPRQQAWTPSRKMTDLSDDELYAVMIDQANFPMPARVMAGKIVEQRQQATQAQAAEEEEAANTNAVNLDDMEVEEVQQVQHVKRAATAAPKGMGKGGKKRTN
jgi:hypothetical protein